MKAVIFVAGLVLAGAAFAHDKPKPPAQSNTTVVHEKKEHTADKLIAAAVVGVIAWHVYEDVKKQRAIQVKPRADGATLQFVQKF